ncbi:hypothetical protein C4D60_Mb09t19130 [Musa balbisiana]|uniref:Uncharacterized protein n=1 Tax=Musa balbisiana TaxID=52838 RepID=A0A4S8IHG5_MUSBA|nr:hypothetical protein C4D60_Mb09t19130 [Musa balbisiana]
MTKGFNNIIGAILEKSLGFPLKEPNPIFLFSPWTRGGAIVGGGDSPSSRSRSPRSRDEEENHQGISKLEEGTPIEFQEGRSPKEINPKLRICKGSNTWYQSSVLGVSLPFHSHPSALHNRPKQFPQLLKRSSPNSAIISTTADHPLISPNLEEGTPIEFQGGRSPKEINPKLRICKGPKGPYEVLERLTFANEHIRVTLGSFHNIKIHMNNGRP